MSTNKNQRIILSRDGWLELALETLVEQGHSKFSLDALIAAMPVGKGSFYHHFRNREEFLLALVEFWDRHETQNVIAALEAMPANTSPEEKLWQLMCVVYETMGARHELLIRSMTLEFPEVRKCVEAVDAKRIAMVRGLFADIGFADDELEMRTLAFVTATGLDALVFSTREPEAYERQLKLRHRFFVRK